MPLRALLALGDELGQRGARRVADDDVVGRELRHRVLERGSVGERVAAAAQARDGGLDRGARVREQRRVGGDRDRGLAAVAEQVVVAARAERLRVGVLLQRRLELCAIAHLGEPEHGRIGSRRPARRGRPPPAPGRARSAAGRPTGSPPPVSPAMPFWIWPANFGQLGKRAPIASSCFQAVEFSSMLASTKPAVEAGKACARAPVGARGTGDGTGRVGAAAAGEHETREGERSADRQQVPDAREASSHHVRTLDAPISSGTSFGALRAGSRAIGANPVSCPTSSSRTSISNGTSPASAHCAHGSAGSSRVSGSAPASGRSSPARRPTRTTTTWPRKSSSSSSWAARACARTANGAQLEPGDVLAFPRGREGGHQVANWGDVTGALPGRLDERHARHRRLPRLRASSAPSSACRIATACGRSSAWPTPSSTTTANDRPRRPPDDGCARSRGVSTTVEPCGAPTSSRSRSPSLPVHSACPRAPGR